MTTINDTTRRFPRTLDEAFGLDATSATPIQRFTRANGPADVLSAVAIGLLLAWGMYHYFAG